MSHLLRMMKNIVHVSYLLLNVRFVTSLHWCYIAWKSVR